MIMLGPVFDLMVELSIDSPTHAHRVRRDVTRGARVLKEQAFDWAPHLEPILNQRVLVLPMCPFDFDDTRLELLSELMVHPHMRGEPLGTIPEYECFERLGTRVRDVLEPAMRRHAW